MHSISRSGAFPSVSAAGEDPAEPMQVELGPPGEWFKWQVMDRRRKVADVVSELGASAQAGHCLPEDLEHELVGAMRVVIEEGLSRCAFVDAVVALWRDGQITKPMVTNILAGRWNDRTPMEHELLHHRGRPRSFFEALMNHLASQDGGDHCFLPEEIVDMCSMRATSDAEPGQLIELFSWVGGAGGLGVEANVGILGKLAQQAGKDPATAGAIMYAVLESTAQPHEVRILLKLLPFAPKDLQHHLSPDIWKAISDGLTRLAHAEALLRARPGKVRMTQCPADIAAAVRSAHLQAVRTSEPGQMVCSATHAIPSFSMLSASAARSTDDPNLYYYEIPLARLEVSGLSGSKLKL